MTVEQYKLFLLLISQLAQEKEFSPLKEYKLRLNDYIEMKGIEDRYTFERHIDSIVSYLKEHSAITIKEPNRITTFWIFSRIKFEREKNDLVITYKFTSDFYEKLMELKSGFLLYHIKSIMPMRSKYSIRLYELLKQYEKIGKREFTVDELKELLGTRIVVVDEKTKEVKIIQDEYSELKDFRRYVIEKAIKEINNYSDIEIIDVIYERERRKIKYITFHFKQKDYLNQDYIEVQPIEEEKPVETPQKPLINWLEIKQLRRKHLLELIEILRGIKEHTLSSNQILFFLINTDRNIYDYEIIKNLIIKSSVNKNLNNLTGFLIKILKIDLENAKHKELLQIDKEMDFEIEKDIYDILLESRDLTMMLKDYFTFLEENQMEEKEYIDMFRKMLADTMIRYKNGKIYIITEETIPIMLLREEYKFDNFVKDYFKNDKIEIEIISSKDLDMNLLNKILLYKTVKK